MGIILLNIGNSENAMIKNILENVELRVPCDPSYVSVVRLMVAGLAHKIGLSADDIDNLKLAVTEAFLLIIGRSKETRQHVRIRWETTANDLRVAVTDPTGRHTSLTRHPTLNLIRSLGSDVESGFNKEEGEFIKLDFHLGKKNNTSFIAKG